MSVRTWVLQLDEYGRATALDRVSGIQESDDRIRVIELEPVLDLLERVLNELEGMDAQIHSEWGVGKYVEEPIVTDVRSLLRAVRGTDA